jgi:glycosyltransferase involved in cell wall biosynthesis
MKIGFDAKRAFFNQTGLGNYSRDAIRVLGHYFEDNQYILYTPKKTNNVRLGFMESKPIYRIVTPKNLFGKIFSSWWRTAGLTKDLEEDKLDVFHGLSHELPLGIEKSNIKSVVTIHDLIFIRYPSFFNSIDRKIYLKKFKHACTVADKIIAVSQQTKRDIEQFLDIPSEKIEVVYQGCNKIFQSQLPTKTLKSIKQQFQLADNYLLYVGTIEERKNLLTLLKCLKELPEQKLVVIGNGRQYKNSCLDYIKANGLADRVQFLQNLNLEQLAGIYQQADIMIYPSLFEGFGIPILESLFCKTAVITSKDGCFKEAGGKSSYYIDPLDILEMKSAILKILSDDKLKSKMEEDGYAHAQSFTDDKIANNLMSVYQNLQ